MEDFVRPDLPSKCLWTQSSNQASPHTRQELSPPAKIVPNVLHLVGNTPLVKLNKIPQSYGIKCEVLVKCEFFNPGGSVKDRIGLRMVEDAEQKGILKPGCTIIEPTSGNTGIGLALASVVKGYRCIIVMPEKMSNEKVDVLKALGAEIVRTPTAAAFDSPEGLIAVSQKIQKQIPNSVILDQYRNAGNPLAHYDKTGSEIIEQCDGKVDMVVLGAGTGGTITGVGRKIKEVKPDCKVIAADPYGSILSEPEELNKSDVNFYEVEGIGYDFIPTVLDRCVVDKWIKVSDQEALPMARRLIKEEGLLCGGSSGSALAAAMKAAVHLKEGQRCVVLLPDGVRNYMTKFLSDHWMEARKLSPCNNSFNHWWWNDKVSSLQLHTPTTILPTVSCMQAYEIMKKQGFDQLPVVDNSGAIRGMATMKNLLSQFTASKVQPNEPISSALFRQYRNVTKDDTLGVVSRILEKDPFVLIVGKNTSNTDVLIGLITSVDLINYMTKNESSKEKADQ